jgi:hypothetical protein
MSKLTVYNTKKATKLLKVLYLLLKEANKKESNTGILLSDIHYSISEVLRETGLTKQRHT